MTSYRGRERWTVPLRTFDDARQDALTVEAAGIPVRVIGRRALIANMRAAGRPKDLADLEVLEAESRAARLRSPARRSDLCSPQPQNLPPRFPSHPRTSAPLAPIPHAMPRPRLASPSRCRPLRVESDEHLWFVTSRVIEERFWLHPILTSGLEPPNREARRGVAHLRRHSDQRLATLVRQANARRGPLQPELTLELARLLTRDLVGSAPARAQERYHVKVYALTVMSNHVHLVVQTRDRNLAAFMGYFKARVADAINLLTGRRGPLWARRYDAQAIIDDDGAAGRVGYTLDNPRQANLVDDSAQWPGLNLAFGMGDADQLTFRYLDRTAWHRAKRPDDLTAFLRDATLTLSPIPSCEEMPRALYAESVRAWMDDAHGKVQARRGERPNRTLGVDKVVHTAFDARPRAPSFSRRPYAFGHPERVRAHNHAVLVVIADYTERAERYRSGFWNVDFPEGTYRPPLMRAA